ncbi:MAG: sterol desaturase family protein [Hyphomicrobiaceae bacterium]|nr:sterol desaturase family protein [Hyphomicrobiaceae bacterium]
MVIGLNAVAYAIVAGGHSYAWLALVLAGALALVFAAERVSPAYGDWNADHGDTPANWLHAAVYEVSNINGVLLIPVIVWLFPFEGIWPRDWPLVAQLLLAIVFADFIFTMVHYFSHRWPMLWRLHAVHHGVPRLYGLNGLVRHPLHQTLDMVLGTAPLVIMGMPVEVAVLLGFAISIQLLVQHANVDYVLGPFTNHLAIGRLHHLHHVNWGKEGDCNFGLFFTIWDRMLGTLTPESSRPIQAHDMGVDEVPEFPKTYWQQLVFPFVYQPGAGRQTGLERPHVEQLRTPAAAQATENGPGASPDSASAKGMTGRISPAE